MNAPRKRRLDRIGSSHFAGSAGYAPSDRDWVRIETAYGRNLEPSIRSSIVEAVKTYIRDERFEQRAPFVRDVQERLDRIDRTARDLNRAMQDNPKSDAAGPEFQAQVLIEQCLVELPQVKQDGLGALRQGVIALIIAVRRAKEKLGSGVGAGLVEGDAWDMFVCALTKIVTEHRLPSGVSKGLDKSASGASSPFVALVHSLQSTFPPESRRHTASDQAIAQAITVARRARRRREAKLEKSLR